MALWILRIVFIVAAAGVALTVMNSRALAGIGLSQPFWVFATILAAAFGAVALDVFIPRKRIEMISCVYFGIVIGLFLTYMLGFALEPLFMRENLVTSGAKNAVQLVTGVMLCYLCISFLLQTRDDFRFVIPYVEFSKEVKGVKPYLLDTSVVIDGRIADLVETQIFDNQLVMPRFVLSELQAIADSGDKLRRSRGRRGLDVLNRLRSNTHVDFRIHDREMPDMVGQPVDMKLVLLAKHLQGKVITGDYNLNKMAKIQGVQVINLNDIANSLKPVFLPGESVEVRVVKPGEEMGQGVGYLDDGTMIVIEGGRDHVGRNVRISVTSVLQTSAGRMIFGRYVETV